MNPETPAVIPMVDRADFLEGRLEALREMKTKIAEALYDARMGVHLVLEGETDAVGTKEALDDLMAASRDALDHLDDEIVHARWKLSAARRRDASAMPAAQPHAPERAAG